MRSSHKSYGSHVRVTIPIAQGVPPLLNFFSGGGRGGACAAGRSSGERLLGAADGSTANIERLAGSTRSPRKVELVRHTHLPTSY